MTTDQQSPLDYPLDDPALASPPRRPDEGKVLIGVGLGLLMHIAVIGGSALVGWPLIVVVGLVQLVYLVPAWIILRIQGKKRSALGILILAAVTFILNSACWGAVLIAYGNLH